MDKMLHDWPKIIFGPNKNSMVVCSLYGNLDKNPEQNFVNIENQP